MNVFLISLFEYTVILVILGIMSAIVFTSAGIGGTEALVLFALVIAGASMFGNIYDINKLKAKLNLN